MAAGRSKSPAQAGLDSAPSRSKSSGAAEISDDSDTDIDIEANGGKAPPLTTLSVSMSYSSVALVHVELCRRILNTVLFADAPCKTMRHRRLLYKGKSRQAGYA